MLLRSQHKYTAIRLPARWVVYDMLQNAEVSPQLYLAKVQNDGTCRRFSSVINGASSHSPPIKKPRNIFIDPRIQPTKRSLKRPVPSSPSMRNILPENHIHSFDMHVLAALRVSIFVAILNIAKSVLSTARLPQHIAINSTAATQQENTTLALPPPNTRVTNPVGYVECHGSRFGIDLSKQSCVDALGSLPVDITLRTFGQRDEGAFDILLPRRYLSTDGLCAIDVSSARGRPYGDSTTNAEIQAGAQRLVNQCVLRGSRKLGYRAVGGAIRDLGT